MMLSTLSLVLAMTSSDAVATLLNSSNATGSRTYAEAREIVEREAAQGKPLQQFVIGVTTDDEELAKRYIAASKPKIRALAEEKGNSMAWYLLSMESNDYGQLKRAAEGGNVQALNALGTIVTQEILQQKNASSNDVARALRKSFGCFERAVAQNDANAFVNLGACYLNGLGCERDLAMAFTCFKNAADLGHPEGMDSLAAAYALGHGVAKDMEKSAVWRMRAKAVRGDEAARKWIEDRKRLKDGK